LASFEKDYTGMHSQQNIKLHIVHLPNKSHVAYTAVEKRRKLYNIAVVVM